MSIARSVVGQYLEERPVAEGAITPELSPPPRTYNTPDTLHMLSMNRFHSHCIQTSIRQGTAMKIDLGKQIFEILVAGLEIDVYLIASWRSCATAHLKDHLA
jgi:hypothetical protein